MKEPEESKVPSSTEQPTQQPSPTEVATQQPSPTEVATQQPSPTSDPINTSSDGHAEMLVNHEDRIAELEAALKQRANRHVTEVIVELQNELSMLKAKLRHML